MGDLTKDTPKCLLPVGGKPMFNIWIEKLVDAGVNKIIVNAYHCWSKIFRHLLDKYDHGSGGMLLRDDSYLGDECHMFRTVDNQIISFIMETKLRGSAKSLHEIKYMFDEPFFIIYSDVWTTFDLKQMLWIHDLPHLKDSLMTIAIYKPDNIKSRGVVELHNGCISGFEEKPDNPKSDYAFSGLIYAEPEILDTLTPDMKDIGRDWLPEVVKSHKVGAVSVLDPMIDIGTPESYAKANEEAKKP